MPDKPTKIRYGTLSWLVIAAALAYLCRNAVGVAESTIREDLGLSFKQSGAFMGAFFWTYALFQVPSGWLAQWRGTRIALTIFALGWTLATFGIAAAPAFWALIAAQLLMGIAQAGIFPASTNSIGHWMPFGERAFACGLLAAGMQVGAVVSGGLTGELIEPLGWRWVFVLFALPGVAWCIGFYLRFRDQPEGKPSVNAAELALIRDQNPEEKAAKQTPLPWKALVASSSLWLLCGQQICRASGYMFFASWFPTFLQQTRDISVKDSGYLQAFVFAGTLAGSVLGGKLVDLIWKRTGNLRISRGGIGAGCLLSCGLLILAAWFATSSTVAVVFLSFGALFAAIAGPCAFTATIDIGGRHVPQVFGLMNMSGNFAAALCPVAVGWLFEQTENWNLILLLFAGIYIAGAAFWLFVDPTKAIRSDDGLRAK